MEWTIELVLVVLLVATLLQAIKLERALGVLKKDRASLEALVAGFNASTHQAESGIQRLHAAADGAGRQIESQIARSVSLKDDLAFLTERGERLADRLDIQVRAAQALAPERKAAERPAPDRVPAVAQAAPRPARANAPTVAPDPVSNRQPAAFSQAELDLLAALRMAR